MIRRSLRLPGISQPQPLGSALGRLVRSVAVLALIGGLATGLALAAIPRATGARPDASLRPAAWLASGWSAVDDGPTAGLLVTPDGSFAGLAAPSASGPGESSSSRDIEVLRSADGRSWQRVSTLAGSAGLTPHLAWNGRVYLAVAASPAIVSARSPAPSRVWTSTDLAHWTSRPGLPFDDYVFARLYGGDGFFVATAVDDAANQLATPLPQADSDCAEAPQGGCTLSWEAGGATVWTSADGTSWSRSAVEASPSRMPPDVSGRVVALPIAGWSRRLAVTSDGRLWRTIDVPSDAVSAAPDWLAVGPDPADAQNVPVPEQFVWRSADGTAWQKSVVVPHSLTTLGQWDSSIPAVGFAGAVADGAGGYLLSGTAASADGPAILTFWHVMSAGRWSVELHLPAATVPAVVANGRRIIVVDLEPSKGSAFDLRPVTYSRDASSASPG